jgi:hypothetical protein
MLTNIHEIDQTTLQKLMKSTILVGGNLLALGPAGVGKTAMAEQIVQESGLRYIYLNLSVLEAPDFIGLPTIVNGRVKYAAPDFMPVTDMEPENTTAAVLVLDEVDKTKPELQYPLLELLLYRSINGRPLNVKACFLTGNLPDEGAFSQPLNHAVTNRCKVYKLTCRFEDWAVWAREAGVNPLILGFLDRNQELLLKPPPDGDPTAYCHPSPRAWTMAATDLNAHQHEEVDFQSLLISGYVGHEASLLFRVWLEHYRHVAPTIDKIVEKAEYPKPDFANNIERLIVTAIGCTGRLSAECKKKNKDKAKIRTYTANTFNWISTLASEFQIAAVKSSLDMAVIKENEMTQIPIVMNVFKSLNNILKGN